MIRPQYETAKIVSLGVRYYIVLNFFLDICTTSLFKMTNESIYCYNAYYDVVYLSPSFITGLVITSIVLAILTVTANVFVLYALIATEQLNNISIRLIFFLSIADACIGGYGLSAEVIIYLRSGNKRICQLELFSEFCMVFLGHTSAYIIGLIGFDRYFRIKYLTRYKEVVKSGRMHVALFILTLVALLQSSLDIYFKDLNELLKIEMFMNIVGSFLVMLPYVLSVLKIRRYKKGVLFKQVLKTVDGVITQTATGIVISIIVLYIPYITINTIYIFLPNDSPIRETSWVHDIRYICYLLLHTCPFVDALIFLNYNRKCRKKIVDVLSVRSKSGIAKDVVQLGVRNPAAVI